MIGKWYLFKFKFVDFYVFFILELEEVIFVIESYLRKYEMYIIWLWEFVGLEEEEIDGDEV